MLGIYLLPLQSKIRISVKIFNVVNALEQFAPLPLQESFDNAGLQVGLTEAEVSGALLCLDITKKIIDEALALGCNLIISHHPLIFHKLACVTDADYVQRLVMKALKSDITIFSMHTNVDNVRGGVNFKIAEKLKLVDVDFASEVKVVNGIEGASLVLGRYESPIAADDFVLQLRHAFDVVCVQCNELLRRSIEKVAICGGAGSFLIQDAVKAGADAFITGEAHYHELFGREQKIQIAVIGHYQSEQYTNEIFKSVIEKKCPNVQCYLTKNNTNPIIYL